MRKIFELRIEQAERLQRVVNARAKKMKDSRGLKGRMAQEMGVSQGQFSNMLTARRDLSPANMEWLEAEEGRLGLTESAGVGT